MKSKYCWRGSDRYSYADWERLLAELLMYLFRFASSHGDEEEDEELSDTGLTINGPGS